MTIVENRGAAPISSGHEIPARESREPDDKVTLRLHRGIT